MPDDMTACPYCREPIRRDALMCRWCGESLKPGGPGTPMATPPPPPRPVPPPPGGPAPLPRPFPRSIAPPPAPRARTAPPGTSPFILGLLGLVLCQLLAPFAWISGNSYEAQCRAMGVAPDGLGTAGKIMGIIGTLILIAGCGLGTLGVALGGLAD
jgi:hypothetical protein